MSGRRRDHACLCLCSPPLLTAISKEKKKPRKTHSCTWQQVVVESSRCAQIWTGEWEIDWETEVLLDNLLFSHFIFAKNKPLPFPVRYAGLQGFTTPLYPKWCGVAIRLWTGEEDRDPPRCRSNYWRATADESLNTFGGKIPEGGPWCIWLSCEVELCHAHVSL